MNRTGNFIQCLTVHNNEVYRDFIEGDDIEGMKSPQTKEGYFRYELIGTDDNWLDRRAYYRVWLRTRAQRRNAGGKDYTRLAPFRFVDYLKSQIRLGMYYANITIMKFKDNTLLHPISITEDDYLVKQLKHYHSKALKDWIGSFITDDLAPTGDNENNENDRQILDENLDDVNPDEDD